jgi:hypothetical protein
MTSGGTRTAADRARSRISRSGSSTAPEAPRAARVLEERVVERQRPEVGPQHVAEHELRVGTLPDEEVADPLLAAGPDQQVGVGHAGGVQGVRDGALVDRLGRDAARGQPPERVDELRPARVVEGDVEEEPIAVGRARQRVLDRLARGRRQLLAPAEEPDPDALRAQLVGLVANGLLQEPEEPGHLVVRAGPVLAAEGVQGEHRHPPLHRVTEQAADGLDACRVAFELRPALRACPAPIAVHDDRDVPRQLVERQERVLRRGIRGGRRGRGRLEVGVGDRRRVRGSGQLAPGRTLLQRSGH